MLVNADHSRRAVVVPDQYQWTASPQAGVERVMLDRLGGERARATSIVKYAPCSYFPQHGHPGGEEVLVLCGTFSEGDEHYPAGWYLRNPPGSSHQPSSAPGAVLFVKLLHMLPEESRRVRIDTRDPSAWARQNDRDVCPLFADGAERVALERLQPSEALFARPVQGAELLVLAGDLYADGQSHAAGSWMRLPAGQYPDFVAGENGATLYLRTRDATRRTVKE